MTTDDLLTPLQVARMLGISSRTLAVWRCERRYNLRYVKIGAAVRYRNSDVLQFIEQRSHTGEPTSRRVRK